MHVAESLRFPDRAARPLAGRDVIRLALAVQQVHRDLRELLGRAALQEQHLVVLRYRQQLAQVGLGLGGDADELLAAMAHLHHAHAGAMPVEHLVAGTRKDFLGQHRGTGAEIEDTGHQWIVGPDGSLGAAGGVSPSEEPLPPLPPPLPSTSSRSTMRSIPASFSPSPRLMSVTPCV